MHCRLESCLYLAFFTPLEIAVHDPEFVLRRPANLRVSEPRKIMIVMTKLELIQLQDLLLEIRRAGYFSQPQYCTS